MYIKLAKLFEIMMMLMMIVVIMDNNDDNVIHSCLESGQCSMIMLDNV